MGANRIEASLRRSFFWPHMGEDVRKWTTQCTSCCEHKAGPEVRAPLQPIQSSYPLETVAIDFLSLGNPQSPYPYVLVMTDLFSRFGWAVPTKDQTAVTTAQALWRHVIQIWGCPERILSDRGSAFESTVLQQLCNLYGCKKVRTTPYHPQGNGACERFNQTLLTLLGSLSDEEKTRWTDSLPALLFTYNNTAHSSTGLTPHFVLTGRHARLPVELATGAPTESQVYNMHDWVAHHHRTLTKAYKHVITRTKAQQQKDKGRYDKRAQNVPLLPGERVLLRNFRRHDQGKLAPRWQQSPYVVVSQIHPDSPVYEIRPEGHMGPIKTMHRNNLRPCPVEPSDQLVTEPAQPTHSVPSNSMPLFLPVMLPVTEPRAAPEPEGNERLPAPGPPHEQPPVRRSQRRNLGNPPLRYRKQSL
uniref:Gypsy retrotransposon integrase-like protein 1 n=1 Tax=Neogobius melanostomus TaxID=47308 RepID=A0A8C6UUI6_9GOBI